MTNPPRTQIALSLDEALTLLKGETVTLTGIGPGAGTVELTLEDTNPSTIRALASEAQVARLLKAQREPGNNPVAQHPDPPKE